MPLHLQEISTHNERELYEFCFSQIHQSRLQYVSNNGIYILLEADLKDSITDEVFGKIVYTTKKDSSLLDMDMVLNNDNKIRLNFIEKCPPSSEKNEYYLAEPENGCRFLLETVSRHCIEENILHSNQDVSLCMFPFEYACFDTMEDLNRAMGIKKDDIFRLDEHFINPMSLFEQTNETYSFLIGKVESFKEVTIAIESQIFSFAIVYINSGIGILPAAFNNSILDSLKMNQFLAIYADIKADLNNQSGENNENRK